MPKKKIIVEPTFIDKFFILMILLFKFQIIFKNYCQ